MRRRALLSAAVAAALVAGVSVAVMPARAAAQPWMNTALSPVDRANALLAQMTLAHARPAPLPAQEAVPP